MKRIYFKGILSALCALMLSSSCITEDNNRHPFGAVDPDFLSSSERLGGLFPTMLFYMHNFQQNANQMIEQMIGNQYGGYMVTTNPWQGTNFGTFNPPQNWIDWFFDNAFPGFYSNYFEVVKVTGGEGYVYAWANVIRVAVMLRLADTYGPIPYSKMGSGEFTVPYDSVQELYHAMIQDLTDSATTLAAFAAQNPGTDNPMAEYDLVYGGDFAKWVKFANSLKLRMAVRIGLVDTEYAKTAMGEAIRIGVITSNADNAFLTLQINNNPYRLASATWYDLAVSATLTAYMNGYSDPRRPVYMTAYSGSNYRGYRMGHAAVTHGNKASTYSLPNFTESSPLLVFCAAENCFLQAEAALRGWITGDPQALYEEGIRTSMEQHGVVIGSYLTSTSNPANYAAATSGLDFNVATAANGGNITVSWDHTATLGAGMTETEKRLEKIITQKWLANYPLGFEAWCDFRRTGYPRLIPAVNNLNEGEVNNPTIIGNGDHVTPGPVRMAARVPYPSSEYSGNSANLQYAIDQLLGGEDNMATPLWWARKP